MSTEIKNTLFRFVTMRSPEVLENDQIVKSFVSYPEFTSNMPSLSEFLDVAIKIPEGRTKAKALAEATAKFQTGGNMIHNREQLHTSGLVSKSFFDFAIWLTTNRTTITAATIDAELNNSDPLSRFAALTSVKEGELFVLWENLFCQIITFKSGYVRDAILSVLVADFFLRNYQGMETDDALRKLAQARVIIPKVLFDKEDTSA